MSNYIDPPKIVQITATRGADDTPCCYVLMDNGILYLYSQQYGYEECRPFAKKETPHA